MNDSPDKIVATTFKGLEDVLAREIKETGGKSVRKLVRAVEFYGDKALLYKANMKLSTALRILLPVAHWRNIKSVSSLYNKAYEFPWENYFHSRKSIFFHFSGELDTIPHSKFVSQKVKDAIADRFRDRFGHRPDIDKENPQIRINLHLFRDQITVSLDSSGDPLFKRGYREDTGPAPLNEVLAAGLVKLTKWHGETHLIDPMCGSGTILIEAVMQSMHIPPNLNRDFSFMHWKNFDESVYKHTKEQLKEHIRTAYDIIQVAGYDKDAAAVEKARQNAVNAGVDKYIRFEHTDFFETRKIPGPVTLIFNPPYDKRLSLVSREKFYKKMAGHLKENYKWAVAWMITPERMDKYFHKKPVRSYRLMNGKIPVWFSGFNLD